MLLRKAYRFRIYPDATQEELFRRTIGFSRLVYNLCLDQKILERERSRPRKLSAYDQMKELTALCRTTRFSRRSTTSTRHSSTSLKGVPAFRPFARRARTAASAIRIPSR